MRLCIAVMTLLSVILLADVRAEPPKKEDIPKFIATLKSSTNTKARVQAAEDIGHRGAIRASDVAESIDLLIGILKQDKDAEVRRACAKALGEIGSQPEKSVDALKGAINDANINVKIAAMTALGQFGREAKGVVPILKDIAQQKDDKKASQAAKGALQMIQMQIKQ
jgi:HEAT repeat protein